MLYCVYHPGLPEEVCYFQTFRAQCPSNQLVIMEQALYGRMKPGVCYTDTGDYDHCTVNVLAIGDKLCSGKQVCDIGIPNQEYEDSMSCPIKGYFEGTYKCRDVYVLQNHTILTMLIFSYDSIY